MASTFRRTSTELRGHTVWAIRSDTETYTYIIGIANLLARSVAMLYLQSVYEVF